MTHTPDRMTEEELFRFEGLIAARINDFTLLPAIATFIQNYRALQSRISEVERERDSAFARGAREGWMRCGVFNFDIHFEDDEAQTFELDQRYPITMPDPLSSRAEAAEARVRELSGPHALAVLSQMCFEFIALAKLWRDTGTPVPTKAEAEQGFFLQAMLPFALEHGERWKSVFFEKEIGPRLETARAKDHP